MQKLFDNNAEILKKYKYCAIGASVYKTDTDLKAKMDEFRFYNVALTEAQAKKAYDNYKVSDEVIQGLSDKVTEYSKKSISFYTEESYKTFSDALEEAKKGIDNPVTVANVGRLIKNLEDAAKALVFYNGVDESTTFSSAQLEDELKEAKNILSAGGLSEGSEAAINSAVEAAEAAINGTDQEVVDNALIALRAAVEEKSYGATLNFDASPENRKTPLLHGSTGFLYGVSEVNVPSSELLKAISPKILVQKAADGQQHPSGDGYRLANYLKSCGVENIQIYVQDYYLQWPYESNGIDDYKGKVEKILTRMFDDNGDGVLSDEEKQLTDEELRLYSFVLFNEPDNIWYRGKLNDLCNDWKTIYTTVKGINKGLKVAGPNFAGYNSNAYNTFLSFCKDNNCLPEYITWHELQKDKLVSFKRHCDELKGFVKTYYADSDIKPVIFVNETVNFDDIGNPGALVNWLAVFDEEDTYASLPYWSLANSMNELAADTNKPNGAWWVYKWYAQMTGDKMPLELENVKGPSAYGRLYGLSSVDDTNSTIHTLFGGEKGRQRICIKNINQTETFKGADKAHVKIYSTKFTGHHGFADEVPVEFEGNLAFTGNDLSFTITGSDLMDAYYAVITPATGEEVTSISAYNKNWEQTYEAEEAEMIGAANAFKKTNGNDLARSNRAEVGGLNSESDGVKFTVNVPEDGRYRLNIYYTSQAPQVDALTLKYVASGGQNRAIGKLSSHTLSVDNGEQQEIVYDSTVKWGYYNYKTVYLDLTKGEHTLTLMYKGEDQNGKDAKTMLCALLDKIDLSYVAGGNREICIEPEELTGIQEGFSFSQEGNYTGAGTASGSGDFDFYVNAPEDGFYSFTSVGNGSAALSKSKVNYASDAKAESEISTSWIKLCDVVLGENNNEMVYLTAGINHLKLSGGNMVLDKLVFTQAPDITSGNTQEIEAENCSLSGEEDDDGYTYFRGGASIPKIVKNNYASGGKVIEGFRGGKNSSLSLTVNVPEAGNYKLSVYYSNNEPAPVMKKQDGSNYVHPYNTDLVERYMQISVNDGTPQTVYFRNTLCWDTFRNTIVDVELQKGENTIKFTNDNSYKFSTVQDDFTPRLDKFAIAPAAIITPEKPSEEAVTPVISTQPVSAAYKKGDSAKALTVEASVSDDGTLSYQWYKNTANSTEGAEIIAGATENSYTPSTEEAGTVYYYCKVTNTKGTSSKETDSQTAKIEVTESSVTPSEKYKLSVSSNSSNIIVSLDKNELGKDETAILSVKPETGYIFKDAKSITVDCRGLCLAGSQTDNHDGSYSYEISNLSGDCEILVSAETVPVPEQYIVTYKNNVVNNTKISVSVSGKEFESGSKVAVSDRLKVEIAPESGYTFTESPVVTASNAITSVAEIKDDIYTFTIHTFKGDTDISINGETAKVQYNISISPDAQKAAEDKHVTPQLDTKDVSAGSTARLILSPEKGYSIKSAVITKKENTCTVSGWERGANGVYIITLSSFTGNTEITNISIDISEVNVYENGTNTSINIGAANISETNFNDEKGIENITKAITNEEFIDAVINTKNNEELLGSDKTETVKEITAAIDNGKNIEMFIEVNEETNIEENTEKETLEALKDAEKDAEEKTGGKVTVSKFAMPLDISLFAKVEGVDAKVRLKDTNTKKMVIKITIPVNIEKEKEDVTRSYYVVRFHEGTKENIPCKYDRKANTIKFESDKFSTYALCYVDTKRALEPVTPTPGTSSKPGIIAPYPVYIASPSPTPGTGGTGSATPIPSPTPGTGGTGSVTPSPSPTPGTGGTGSTTPIPSPTPGTGGTGSATPVPSPTPGTGGPQATKAPVSTKIPSSSVKKVTIKNSKYKIVTKNGKKTATLTGVKNSIKKVAIPASVKAGNKTYKVTAIAKNAFKGNKKITKVVIGANISKIGENAFKGCSKLKKIIVKSKKLKMKNVGKNTFKGINKKAVIKVPKGKVKLYKKIVKARGAGKKIKIKE